LPVRIEGYPPPPDPLVPFAQRWQREAESAEQQGRLADALWAREALALAVPPEARLAAQADVARLRAAIDARVQEALARGREAQRRGDADGAQRAWLQALLLDPGQATAADALRAMERERNERQWLARAVQAPRADPALRLQLADLHVRRARSLPPDRRADAVAALREALRLEPRHEGAREALAQIAPEAAGASAAPPARAPSPGGARSAP
jgi:tetratricopeptide (TPR) repeat protein